MLILLQRKIAFLACFALIAVGLFCADANIPGENIHGCLLNNHSSAVCDSDSNEHSLLASNLLSTQWSVVFIGILFLSFYLKTQEKATRSIPPLSMYFYYKKALARKDFYSVLTFISQGILQPRLYETVKG